jgi:carbon monoxide dehydrogenase subunit G
VWTVLHDVERVATWVPGVVLDQVDGDRLEGSAQVKVGPISMTYRGIGRIVERDDSGHRLVLSGAGKDVQSQGGVRAELTMQLSAATPSATRCTVVTDLDITGRPAQLGRGVIQAVGARLMDEFARRLADELRHPADARAEPAARRAVPVVSQADGGSPSPTGYRQALSGRGPRIASLAAIAAAAVALAVLVGRRWNCRRGGS